MLCRCILASIIIYVVSYSLIERPMHFELGEVLKGFGEFLFASPTPRDVEIKLNVIIGCTTFFLHLILI